jgi:hypothetical protein
MRHLGKVFGVLLLGAVVTGMTVWAMGALYYAPLPPRWRGPLALTFGLATAGAFLGLPRRRWTLLIFVLVWGTLGLWWSTIPASNSRAWQPDVAVLPSATLHGDRVTLHNIRNFAYRTATDFTPRYYDKTFDLQQLESVDLISVYWAGEAIAHLMVSFGFGEQDYVAISIETRKERTEDYSAIKGFFKQYELLYVIADERDVLRLRTTYRRPPEEVYLYRTRIPPPQARRLFLDYMREVNQLVEQPVFYNTLTTNCTTNVLFHARASGGIARYNWKVLLSGYAPAYAYDIGRLDTSLTFADLKQRSHINARVQAAGDAPDFSQRIRAGLPRPPPASR